MGRGQRGGSGRAGGSGRGRGGRRGGHGHGHGRQQPAAAPPSGDALLTELRASPAFYAALEGRDCPAAAVEGSSTSGASPLGTSELQMADWKDLGALISWFRDGISADPEAELAFSVKLTKSQRASVHGTANAVGLGALGTASRGVGEGRCVVVMAKQRALRPELDERQDHKAFWTWRWALGQGLQVSRDEVAEMVLGDALTPELQAIWDRNAAAQKAVQQLCAAVVAGDCEAAAAVLGRHPSLLTDGVFDVQTGVAPLHLAAQQGQVPALALLLSKGADPEAPDGHSWTALQVARKFEQSDAEGVLLRAGARDPDKDKSILEQPPTLPADDKPQPRQQPQPQKGAPHASAPVANGSSASSPPRSAAAPAAPAGGPLSDAGSQEGVELAGTSVASVCGTERDNLAAEVGSNLDDYSDPQYQAAAGFPETLLEEEEGEEEESAPPPAAPADAAAEAESARAQAEAVALAARAAAEAREAAEEAAQEAAGAAAAGEAPAGAAAAAAEARDAASAAGSDSEEEAVAAAEAAATVTARDAFVAALAAAEAAELAAEEAESMPGPEAAERAAAFRQESEAAVAAAAAAAVVAGEALDEVLTPHKSRPVVPLPPASSVASVCGSEGTRAALPDPSEFELGSGPLSSAGSLPSQAASSALPSQSFSHGPLTEQDVEEEEEEEEEEQEQGQGPEEGTEKEAAADEQAAAAAAQQAAAEAAVAVAATGSAAPAAGAAVESTAPPAAPTAAATAAAADLRALAASAAEQAASAAQGAAAAASQAVSKARAELEPRAAEWGQWLEAKAPEWKRWFEEHPVCIAAGAGVAAFGITALLLSSSRRR